MVEANRYSNMLANLEARLQQVGGPEERRVMKKNGSVSMSTGRAKGNMDVCNGSPCPSEAYLKNSGLQVEDDNEALSNNLDMERRRRSAAGGGSKNIWGSPTPDPTDREEGSSSALLNDLHTLPRDKWPSPVRRLVEQAERAAAVATAAGDTSGSSKISPRSTDRLGGSYSGGGGPRSPRSPSGGSQAGLPSTEAMSRLEAKLAVSEQQVSDLHRQLAEAEGRCESERNRSLEVEREAKEALRAAKSAWDKQRVGPWLD